VFKYKLFEPVHFPFLFLLSPRCDLLNKTVKTAEKVHEILINVESKEQDRVEYGASSEYS
jgi:hypothetical protein